MFKTYFIPSNQRTSRVKLVSDIKIQLMSYEFTHVMLKVCVNLVALSGERPGRRKTYGPGETRTHDHAVGKPTDLVRLELTTMSFAGIYSTTELPVHIGQVGSVTTW